MRKVEISEKYQRTYKTKGNLEKALDFFQGTNLQFILVKTADHRWTAICSNAIKYQLHLTVINKGFMVVG